MSNVISYDPFAEFRALQRQLFNETFGQTTNPLKMPTTDVWTEEDNRLVVEAHLPNFDEKDIDVNVEDNSLIIRAEKHERNEDKKKHYVVRESSSSFYRSIRLPNIADKESIKAHFKNGILTVNVPFKELPKPKKIAIESKK
jgi:HSP20 family protein